METTTGFSASFGGPTSHQTKNGPLLGPFFRNGPLREVCGFEISFFCTTWPSLRLREPKIFGLGCVAKQQGFPRAVCVCGAVGLCGECHGVGHVVLMTRFVRCVSERQRCEESQYQPSKKPPLASTQACGQRTQTLSIFSNISRLPAHVLFYTRVKSVRNSAGLALAGC